MTDLMYSVLWFKRNPEEIERLMKKCLEIGVVYAGALIDAGSNVLCPGCGWGPKTPLINMKAMVAAGKEYGQNARLAKKK
jgi:uroporphyrinogen-III decarboxylase